MHVLVTGAAGFAGIAVVKTLGPGNRLRCVDLHSMPEPVCGESIVADLTSYQDCLDIVQDVDAIIYLAVSGGLLRCDTPDKPLASTVTATANRLHAADLAGTR